MGRKGVAVVGLVLIIAAVLGVVRLASGGSASISMHTLAREPPILLVVADAQRAATAHSGDLYVLQPAAARVRRLRAWRPLLGSRDGQVYGAFSAHWSPDRSRIGLMLAVWFGDPFEEAAVASRDATHLRALDNGSVSGGVTWSPRGDFTYAYGGKTLRILPPGSSRARPLWKHGGVYFSEVFGDDPVGAPLDWSRDGRRLVAASSKGLVSVTRHGRGVFLTASRLDQSPRWSPDGSTVAFLREPACYVQPTCRQLAGVLLVSASRGGLRRVAAIPKALDLEWYPDGRSLLVGTNDFSGDESARTIHRVAVVDGKDQTLAADARLRDWSPRRTKILFERRGNLWVMDSDGGKQTLLPARPQGVIVGADW